MTKEEWRPIPGYEGHYSVSDQGRVRSEDREVIRSDGVKATLKGRVLTPGTNSCGRLGVNLCKFGVSRSKLIHRLVAAAFLPNPENKPLVRHLDDNPHNNVVENLAWGTYSDNQNDRVRNGIYRNGMTQWTHCRRGHEYTEENTYRPPNRPGSRMCRTCTNFRERERRRRKKERKVQ